MSLLLVAALNGGRSITEHPAVPISPAELAAAAREAVEAGADAVHVHVRDSRGRESLAPEDTAAAAAELGKLGVPFGFSTGAWIISEPARRLEVISRWSVLPDFLSINFDEAGAVELASFLLRRGVGIEAGVAHRLAAEQLVGSGLAERCLRIMFEPREPTLADAERAVAEAELVLETASVRCPRLLHGVDATAWPLLDQAGARGYATRTGFEDTLTLPDGRRAENNAQLVRTARARLARFSGATA